MSQFSKKKVQIVPIFQEKVQLVPILQQTCDQVRSSFSGWQIFELEGVFEARRYIRSRYIWYIAVMCLFLKVNQLDIKIWTVQLSGEDWAESQAWCNWTTGDWHIEMTCIISYHMYYMYDIMGDVDIDMICVNDTLYHIMGCIISWVRIQTCQTFECLGWRGYGDRRQLVIYALCFTIVTYLVGGIHIINMWNSWVNVNAAKVCEEKPTTFVQ